MRAPQHPPAIEAYLRETDRYRAFLVGYRPEAPSAEKGQGLARKNDKWESKWTSVTHTGGDGRGKHLGLLHSHMSLRSFRLTLRQQRRSFKRYILLRALGFYLDRAC